MRTLFALWITLLFVPVAFAIEPVGLAAVGDTTITVNPATPGPAESFAFSVRGSWSDGCVPRFQSVTGSGTSIQIDAVANPSCSACTLAVTPYAFNTVQLSVTSPGIYTVQYYVTECNKPRTLQQSTTIAISGSCQFDRSLTVSAPAVRVGTPALLRWCDPSVLAAVDLGFNVNFYRVLGSHTANGPFVSIGDAPKNANGVGINFDPTDVGPSFFFIEAHGCNVTIAGCTGDVVLRSNVVRVDVVSATGCLPDATTLCLNNAR